jgi:hypothetical protein
MRLLVIWLLLLFPFMASAHGYWLEVEGSHRAGQPATIRMFYGDYPEGVRMSGDFLDKMKDIKVYVSGAGMEKQAIEMKQLSDYWVGTFTPSAAATYEITGINDTRDVQDWTKHNLGITRPIQYLKTYYATTRLMSAPTASLLLDLDMKLLSKGNYQVTVKQNGKVAPAQKLYVSSFGIEPKELVTDADGKAIIKLGKPGLYVLSVDYVDKTPGTFRDKKYESVRHRLDYSLYH